MDYEQKYKEALERAKKELQTCGSTDCDAARQIIRLFPELVEFEDEKIRKALIKGVESCKASGWTNFGNNVDIDVVLAWLEKLGEEKTVNKFNVGDLVKNTNHCKNPIYRIIGKDKECYICKSDDVSLGDKAVMHFAFDNPYLRLVEQKSADKVEPKFKVGDFIVNAYCMGRVVELTDDAYLLDTGQGIPFSCHTTRLWDIIKDAKKGDVLFDGSNILLFKKVNSWHNVASYLAYSQVYGIREYITSGSDVITPATKEQCDLLFQKMRESGYEWNAEKKELKKIEQKPAWSEEDDAYKEFAICAVEDYYGEENPLHTCIVNWLESLKEKYTLSSDELMEKIENLRHKWSMGNSAEAKYKVEAFDELLEMLKEE